VIDFDGKEKAMTTIGALSSFVMAQRFVTSDRVGSETAFGDHFQQQILQPDGSPGDRLSELTAQLDALKEQELRMPIHDFLMAKFSLQDQITAERIKAGEDLETMGIDFGGQKFTIAAKRLDPDLVKSVQLPEAMMARIASHRDYSGV
jgi:hypothetical protein